MTDPRDYHAYLRAAETHKDASSLARSSALRGLLPKAPPVANLWGKTLLLLASAALPAWLWWNGNLESIDVVLLYLAESAGYALTVLARILVTAAAPAPGASARWRSAISFALWHGVALAVVWLIALACAAPKPEGAAFFAWLQGFAQRLGAPELYVPALVVLAALVLDAARRADHIDAYLDFGPATVAKYGHGYLFGLGFLLFGALVLRALLFAEPIAGSDNEYRLEHADGWIPASFLAPFILACRLVWQFVNLSFAWWAPSLQKIEGRALDYAQAHAKRTGRTFPE